MRDVYENRIKGLIHYLRHPTNKVGFNMDNWFTGSSQSDCGTTACLAGHTVLYANQQIHKAFTITDILSIISLRLQTQDTRAFGSWVMYSAAKYLGLSEEQAHDMFFFKNEDLDAGDEPVTSIDAANMLIYFLGTGVVDWHAAIAVRHVEREKEAVEKIKKAALEVAAAMGPNDPEPVEEEGEPDEEGEPEEDDQPEDESQRVAA